jgi:hypothetical protein
VRDAIVAAIQWVMLVSAILTATMVYAAIDPAASLQSIFGESVQPAGSLAVVV